MTLEAAGLPDGAPRPMPTRLDFPAIRSALAALDVTQLDETRRVVLLAWLEAWRHHWPTRFERELGAAGESWRRTLAALPADANRYLKLRRIAVENLAGAL